MELFRLFKKNKNKIALIDERSRKISYKEILDFSKKQKKKIKERCLVLIISNNSIYPILSYISSIINNNVIMLIDIKMNTIELKKLIKLYKPLYVISPIKIKKELSFNNFKEIEHNDEYIMLKTKYKIQPINKDLSLLLPTSGSMGSSKFVKLSKKNLKVNTDSIIDYLKISNKDRAITSMPFSYSYMLSILNSHLEAGASLCVTEKSIMQKEFWNIFKKNRITSLSGVPYMYQFFIKIGLQKIFNKSLKLLTQAGGHLENNLKEQIINFCKEKNIHFIVMYGQTEASPRISYLDWKNAKIKNGSIGKSIGSIKMWLETKNKKMIKTPDTIGEIVIKGENVFMGYSKGSKDLIKKDQFNGFLRTGDLGFYDTDGYFFLQGRLRRIAKVFGIRINLEELEEKINQCGYRIICKNFGNQINIYYEKKLKDNKILERVSNLTGQNKSIFKLKLLKKFPRTNVGKLDYSKLN